MTATDVPPDVVLDRTEVYDGTVSALVLRCGGEIDSLNAPELAAAVKDGLTRAAETEVHHPPGRRLLVVDLREVAFFGASAVTALLVGADTTHTAIDALCLIIGDSGPVRLVVEALELHSIFSIHHDLPDALATA